MIHFTEHSAVGIHHVSRGRPNQDAVRVVQLDPDTRAIAVADGHGSSRHGDIGDRLAVEIAALRLGEIWAAHSAGPDPLGACEAHLRELGAASVLSAWRRSVEACAAVEPGRSRAVPEVLKPFGTTLLAALVRPEGALFLQLGDGCIWFLMDGEVQRARTESPEEGIGETTESLCLPHAERRIALRRVARPAYTSATLLVATDGFQKSYSTDARAESFLRDLDETYRSGSADVISRGLPSWAAEMAGKGSGDDTSIVLVHWEAEVLAVEPSFPVHFIDSAFDVDDASEPFPTVAPMLLRPATPIAPLIVPVEAPPLPAYDAHAGDPDLPGLCPHTPAEVLPVAHLAIRPEPVPPPADAAPPPPRSAEPEAAPASQVAASAPTPPPTRPAAPPRAAPRVPRRRPASPTTSPTTPKAPPKARPSRAKAAALPPAKAEPAARPRKPATSPGRPKRSPTA